MTKPATSATEWRRGWPLVGAAMLGIGTGPGLFQNLSSLFTPGMTEQFGWTRGEIATAAGIGLIGALAAPVLGRLADRIGIRPIIVSAMLLLGAAFLGFANMRGHIWEYQILVLLLALSVPGTSSLVYGKLIATAFVARRGIALGIATSGLSISTLVMPPIIGIAIAGFGWRGGFVALAILAVGIALPIVLLGIRRVPAGPTRPDADSPDAHIRVAGFTGAETRRDGRFWRLGACAALINIATVGLVTQLVPFGLDRGLTPAQAAWLLVAFGASQIVGRLAIGLLIDHYRPQVMAAAVAVISALAFAALQAPAPGFALMLLLVFGAGLMNGAEHDLLPFLAARLFGLRAYGEVYGMLLTIALAGTATGIVGFGRLHDAYGSYAIALGIACGALGLAALSFISLRDRPLPVITAAANPA